MGKERYNEPSTQVSNNQFLEDNRSLLYSRHLDDIDNIEFYGLDAPLISSKENSEKIVPTIDALCKRVKQNNKKAVLFITSPRLRASQTAKIIANGIRNIDKSLHVRFAVDENFKATEQGILIVPPEYKPGDEHKGLSIAGKIFTKESHGSFDGGIDNIDYKFGDSVLLPDGSYKYPELIPYFSKAGESHRESLLRIFKSVLAASKKYKKFLQSTEVVLVAHGQTFHIFRGLAMLGELIKKHQIDFKQGDSVRLLWDIYMKCSSDLKVAGLCVPIEIELLGDDEMMSLLQNEVNFLESNKQ